MRKLMAAIIASLIGLIALSVSNTAVACGGTRNHPMASALAARRRRVRTKKGLHPTMKAFYFEP
jgi:hypothetical protein